MKLVTIEESRRVVEGKPYRAWQLVEVDSREVVKERLIDLSAGAEVGEDGPADALARSELEASAEEMGYELVGSAEVQRPGRD